MVQLIQEYFKYYLILKSLNSIGDFFNHEAKKWRIILIKNVFPFYD